MEGKIPPEGLNADGTLKSGSPFGLETPGPKLEDLSQTPKVLTMDESDRLRADRNFSHRSPNENQISRYNFLEASCRRLSIEIIENCPPSKERSQALGSVQQACMWAKDAIKIYEDT